MRNNSMQGSLGPMELKPLESAVSSLEKGHSTPLKSLDRWRQIVVRGLQRAGLSQKQAASEMGISEAQFSRQLAGVENLSFWKMHQLPASFWAEVLQLIAEYHDVCIGQTVQDREDIALGKLARELVTKAVGR